MATKSLGSKLRNILIAYKNGELTLEEMIGFIDYLYQLQAKKK